MTTPSDHEALAYEALHTKGVRELACGCVLRVAATTTFHVRTCKVIDTLKESGKYKIRCPGAKHMIFGPATYHHFAKNVMT